MAGKGKKGSSENMRRGRDLRTYRIEMLTALVIIGLIVGVAFGVNKFFFGFDRQDSPSSSGTAANMGSDSDGQGKDAAFEQSADWRLVLVNADHPIEEVFDGELTELRYGQKVDSRIYPDLQEMFNDMREEGLSPRVAEAYRTEKEQEKRFEDKVKDYMSYGKTREEATKLAVQWEPAPGTSEHELGICVDVSSETGDKDTANAVWQWMDTNCMRYGFIKRYPGNKSSITGVKGEPWHYRYVGTEAAQEIMESGITLEVYLGAVPK